MDLQLPSLPVFPASQLGASMDKHMSQGIVKSMMLMTMVMFVWRRRFKSNPNNKKRPATTSLSTSQASLIVRLRRIETTFCDLRTPGSPHAVVPSLVASLLIKIPRCKGYHRPYGRLCAPLTTGL